MPSWQTINSLLLTVLHLVPFALSANSTTGHVKQHGGHHMHHGPALATFNETLWGMTNPPTPPSYWTNDVLSKDPKTSSHYGFMIMHCISMCLAFFVALPISISLRSTKNRRRILATLSFYGLILLGCASGGLYKKLTPNLYEGSVHGRHGYLIIVGSSILSIFDILPVIRRSVAYLQSPSELSFKSFWRRAVRQHDEVLEGSAVEYASLVHEEPEEYEKVVFDADEAGPVYSKPSYRSRYSTEHHPTNPAEWANEVGRHRTQDSIHSSGSDTVFGPRSPESEEFVRPQLQAPRRSTAQRVGRFVFATCERALVLAGFGELLSGIVVYTGGCRGPHINVCLAHLSKGGIFWCYGLLTFARFLGSYSDLGWAWNRIPAGDYPTGEFVESLVIFIYGITNTWMERFGAEPGSPFTTRQLQHIGIAIMFWFAGLIGMGLESKRVRRWLASSAASALNPSRASRDVIAEPPSYLASFNPFPALVIGVTGAAMAAHAQAYVFQVQIHALWGNLLLGFSVMRCLTYFFLWLGPPRSILPSRPPTEALGSFFLACGGLVFMMSTEELTVAAMRQGRDDVMMFLNVAVAITCFAFCWMFCMVGFKGWLKSRSHPAVSYHSST